MGNQQLTAHNLEALQGDLLTKIPDEISWQKLAHQPTSDTFFSNTEITKIVIDLKSKVKIGEITTTTATSIPSSPTPSSSNDNSSTLIYFINSKKYEYHIDFVQNVIQKGEVILLPIFNAINYFENSKRRYILATLTKYKDQHKYTLELNPLDDLNYDALYTLFFKMKNLVHFGDKFYFRPTSPTQSLIVAKGNKAAAAAAAETSTTRYEHGCIPILTSEDLFGDMKFQAYNNGTSYGRLRIVLIPSSVPSVQVQEEEAEGKMMVEPISDALSHLEPRDIAVIISDVIPNDIPVCSGIITSTFQAPLCHISILAQNRGTPNMFLKDAQALLKALDNQNVELTVSEQGYTLHPCSEQQVSAYQNSKAFAQIAIAEADRVTVAPPSKSKLFIRESWTMSTCGAKAAHLSEIAKECVSSKNTNVLYMTEGFAVPFSYYFAHMNSVFSQMLMFGNGGSAFASAAASLFSPTGSLFKQYIQQQILPVLSDRQVLTQRLKEVRQGIMQTPVSTNIVKLVQEQLKALQIQLSTTSPLFAGISKVPIIMRSSSNAEDLPGFNGAGLYHSAILPNGTDASLKEIEETIKQVWCSVWTIKSMSERALYRIDEQNVGMGVLVQPLVGGDDNDSEGGSKSSPFQVSAKGVAITTSPIKKAFNAYFVNAQTALGSVTDSTSGSSDKKSPAAEQMLIYKDENRLVVETLSQIQVLEETTNTATSLHVMTHEEVTVLHAELKKIQKSKLFKKFGKKYAADVEFIVVRKTNSAAAAMVPPFKVIILQTRPYSAQMSVISTPITPILEGNIVRDGEW